MVIKIIAVDYQNPKHSADLVTLLRAYARDPMGGGEDLPLATQQNIVPALAQQAGAFSVLAYVDGQPAGLVNCFTGFSTFQCAPLINVHDVAVLTEFRGLKLSQLLLSEVECIAKQSLCRKPFSDFARHNCVFRRSRMRQY